MGSKSAPPPAILNRYSLTATIPGQKALDDGASLACFNNIYDKPAKVFILFGHNRSGMSLLLFMLLSNFSTFSLFIFHDEMLVY